MLNGTVNMITHRWVLVYPLSRHSNDLLMGESLHIVIFFRKMNEAQFDDAV